MTKPRHVEVPKMEVPEVEMLEMELAKDENANEVKIEKFEGPIEPAIIDIIPGKKVKVEGRDETFTIIQKLSNGKVTVTSDNLMLYVKPGELKNIK